MIKSINPATGQIIKEYKLLEQGELIEKIEKSHKAFLTWKKLTIDERAQHLRKVSEVLRANKSKYAMIITSEMGKLYREALAEVEKCAWVCEYFADSAKTYLKPEYVETDAARSYVQFDPLGVLLAVMPWNFPFWQLFRVAAPALMAGNVVVLKHASNVPGCATAIEEIFVQAGLDNGEFQTLLIASDMVESVLQNDRVIGVSLTGSEMAGSKVAAIAGREIKKAVMELGGTDPFVVMPSADLDRAVSTCMTAKYLNCGQVCISAKRLILHKDIAQEFLKKFTTLTKNLKPGDPVDEATTLAPISSQKALEEIQSQVRENIQAGAKLISGGKVIDRNGYFFEPTILTGITKWMPAYSQEIFGPVMLVFEVESQDEAIALANDSRYGLGASVWTQDGMERDKFVNQLECGSVFVNGMVKTDPRLPVGGVKKSGFGREIGEYGIKEFVNIKTVWIG